MPSCVPVLFSVVGMLACESGGITRTLNPALTESDADSLLSTSDASTPATVDAAVSTGPKDTSASGYSAPRTDAGAVEVDAGGSRNILCGLQPGSADVDAGVVTRALARLEVKALGARILTHVSSSADDDFEDLRGAKDLYFIVTLPFDVFRDMSDAEVARWIERAWGVGEQVRYLIIGQQLENDLKALSAEEHARMVSLLSYTLTTAATHPNKPDDSMVGLGLALAAFVPTELIEISQVLAISYSAIELSGAVETPEEALEGLLARTRQVAGLRRPIIFQDLAYPSVHGEEPQREFFANVRQWLTQGNLPDIRALVISSLDAPSRRDCESWSKDWQVADPEVRCSVAVRDGEEAKAALNEVAGLLAHFAQL